MLRSGFVVQPLGTEQDFRIFAKAQIIMSDLPAIAEMLSWKGHNAAKPCPLCMNCTHHKPPGGADPLQQGSPRPIPQAPGLASGHKRVQDPRIMVRHFNLW